MDKSIGNYSKKDFDPKEYLICNPDLIEHYCDLNGLTEHFHQHGSHEARLFETNKIPSNRWDYKNVWNKASQSFEEAKVGVAGYADEDLFSKSAIQSVSYLEKHLDFTTDDYLLEIGCGVGRVGFELSQKCKHWTGMDVSSQMIKFAKNYLKEFGNIDLIESSGYDLSPIDSNSTDKAYCIVVFMHLDEWERYSYVKDAFRVLRSGGKFLVNNINLCSDDGWKLFAEHCMVSPEDRPLNISKTSTDCELKTYFEKSGFIDIKVDINDTLWLTVSGVKP